MTAILELVVIKRGRLFSNICLSLLTRWIHFYDANIIPTHSNGFNHDYAIAHTNPFYTGIDYVNFIVMYENLVSDVPSVPPDNAWVVFRKMKLNF